MLGGGGGGVHDIIALNQLMWSRLEANAWIWVVDIRRQHSPGPLAAFQLLLQARLYYFASLYFRLGGGGCVILYPLPISNQ